MTPYRSWMRVSACLLMLAAVTAACGGTKAGSPSGPAASLGPTPVPTPQTLAAYPSGFPTTWANKQNPPDTRLLPVAGGLQGNFTGTLTAADGSQGTYTATWVENRIAAAKVVCNGLTYTNVYVGETPEVTSDVTFAGWGSATLVTIGHVTVYRSSRNGSSPSICDQSTVGTLSAKFTKGGVTQLMTGTWHFDKAGHLVFDPPAAGSPAPS